jgi:hypothetical protein
MGTAAFLAIVVATFVGVIYVWNAWRRHLHKLNLSTWRRRYATVGLIAVTIQAAIFIAFWTPLFGDDALVARWTKGELLVFLVAVPSVLAGKGPLRWGLLSSSVVLIIASFFTALSP